MKSWPPVDSRSTRRFRRGGTHTHTHTQTNLCRQSRGLEYSRTNKSRWTHSGNHTFKDYMHIRLDRHGTGVLCTASIKGGGETGGVAPVLLRISCHCQIRSDTPVSLRMNLLFLSVCRLVCLSVCLFVISAFSFASWWRTLSFHFDLGNGHHRAGFLSRQTEHICSHPTSQRTNETVENNDNNDNDNDNDDNKHCAKAMEWQTEIETNKGEKGW